MTQAPTFHTGQVFKKPAVGVGAGLRVYRQCCFTGFGYNLWAHRMGCEVGWGGQEDRGADEEGGGLRGGICRDLEIR